MGSTELGSQVEPSRNGFKILELLIPTKNKKGPSSSSLTFSFFHYYFFSRFLRGLVYKVACPLGSRNQVPPTPAPLQAVGAGAGAEGTPGSFPGAGLGRAAAESRLRALNWVQQLAPNAARFPCHFLYQPDGGQSRGGEQQRVAAAAAAPRLALKLCRGPARPQRGRSRRPPAGAAPPPAELARPGPAYAARAPRRRGAPREGESAPVGHCGH